MITPTQMYLIVMLDSIVKLSASIAGMFLIASLMSFFYCVDREKVKWHLFASTALLLFMMVVTTLIPNTKQMAAIIVVPKIINSEKVQTVGNKLYDLAVEWMDELKPSEGENNK